MRSRLIVVSTALLLASVSAASAQIQASPSLGLYEPANPDVFGQIDFGGRFTDVDGDEARYQRYRDLRDGVFFDIPRYHRETSDWWTDVEIRNAGYRDQRYFFEYARPGTLDFRFLYDQTPMYISGDTLTPYRPLPEDSGIYDGFAGRFTIPDDVQRAIEQNTTGQSGIPYALFRASVEALANDGDFFSRVRRDTLGFDLTYDLTEAVAAKVKYVRTRKQGNIPWGASFGFNFANELPLPIDSTANDFSIGAEFSNEIAMFRASWDYSSYNNDAYIYDWDNPLRITDQTYSSAYSPGNGPSFSRGTTWPSNTLNYINFGGAIRMPWRSNLNGTFSIGSWDQDESIPAHTVNTAITPIPLPRNTVQGDAGTKAMTLNFVTRPFRLLDFNARYRYYSFDNETPVFDISREDDPEEEYVRFDAVPEPFSDPALHKIGPEPWGYARNYLDLDAGITAIPFTNFTVGYSYYHADQHYRVFETSTENTFRLVADIIGNAFFSLRSKYEYSQRRGDDIEDRNNNNYPDALEIAGEQPGMRHYDIADRDRNRFTVLGNIMPGGVWGVNASIYVTDDTFPNEQVSGQDAMGLQDYQGVGYTLGFDVFPRAGVNLGASYAYERFKGSSQSRNASPGAQFVDPTRNWGTDEEQSSNSFLVNLDLLKVIPATEMRVLYSYTDYEGSYIYQLTGGAYRPTAGNPEGVAQLSNILSDENRFTVDFRYFIRKNIAIGFLYWYDKYTVDDWALGPRDAVFGGVAQPPVTDLQGPVPNVNGVLLNYLYRDYTANTFWLRLTYLF